jgi:hypothetical protein
MKPIYTGKVLISVVALYAAAGSYFFDWNETHIYNPLWPPHARFHNAQTMLLGTGIGLAALWVLWFLKGDERNKRRVSTVLAGLYWLTQAGSLLFPGTALTDPQFTHAGQMPAQLVVDAVMLTSLAIGCRLEVKRLKAKHP